MRLIIPFTFFSRPNSRKREATNSSRSAGLLRIRMPSPSLPLKHFLAPSHPGWKKAGASGLRMTRRWRPQGGHCVPGRWRSRPMSREGRKSFRSPSNNDMEGVFLHLLGRGRCPVYLGSPYGATGIPAIPLLLGQHDSKRRPVGPSSPCATLIDMSLHPRPVAHDTVMSNNQRSRVVGIVLL